MTALEMVGAAERFVRAFNDAEFEVMRDLLDPSLVAFITTEDGDQVARTGADAYVASLRDMVQRAPTTYQVTLTQKPVVVGGDRVLVMLEIRAEREGRTLHNYSAQLLRFDGAVIAEIQMTDAKPEESARFWA